MDLPKIMGKLNFFAREILSKKTKEEMLKMTLEYAKENNTQLFDLVNSDPEYFKQIINIEREVNFLIAAVNNAIIE